MTKATPPAKLTSGQLALLRVLWPSDLSMRDAINIRRLLLAHKLA